MRGGSLRAPQCPILRRGRLRLTQALYNRIRPRTFSQVVGQEHVTDALAAALTSGRLHHAFLFSGPRGCGKTSSARILAASLNCVTGPTADPVRSLRALRRDPRRARRWTSSRSTPRATAGIDDAREIRERAIFMPASARYKVYIIDEAHQITSDAFNALLKLVEEPPEHLKFIFATTEPDKVLQTIRSRTHHYAFRLVPPAILRDFLAQVCVDEGVVVEPAVLPLVVRAGGRVGPRQPFRARPADRRRRTGRTHRRPRRRAARSFGCRRSRRRGRGAGSEGAGGGVLGRRAGDGDRTRSAPVRHGPAGADPRSARPPDGARCP